MASLLSKYTENLSNLSLNVAPGVQSLGALILLTTGGLFIGYNALTFIRVLFSLFILPGKSVCISPTGEMS